MVQDEVEDTAGVNVQIRVSVKGALHMCFVEFPVNLGSGALRAIVQLRVHANVNVDAPKRQALLTRSTF